MKKKIFIIYCLFCILLLPTLSANLKEERLYEEAKEYYGKAESTYLEGKSRNYVGEYKLANELFKNASEYSKNAKAIYVKLLNWSKDLPHEKQREQKVDFYSKKIKKCETQLERIRIELPHTHPKPPAEEAYGKASKLYSNCDFKNASRYANEAKVLFEEREDDPGISHTDRLSQDINKALDMKSQANSLYGNATKKFQVADFEKSTFYAEKAKEIYLELNCKDEVELCDSLLEKIEEGNESKAMADEFFEKAQKLREREVFNESISYAEKAKKIYQEINYSEGVEKCDKLIEKNNEKLLQISSHSPSYRQILRYFIYLILIIALIVIAIKVLGKFRK